MQRSRMDAPRENTPALLRSVDGGWGYLFRKEVNS